MQSRHPGFVCQINIIMKRLLYQIHRWAGIALALFMFTWFSSGLVIMYAGSSALGPTEQLAKRELLNPQTGWLSLGEAWARSTEQRRQLPQDPSRDESRPQVQPEAPATKTGKGDLIEDARLVRQAGKPQWLIEDGSGRHFALSAESGSLHETSVAEATQIAAHWVANDSDRPSAAPAIIKLLDTGPQDSSVRNQEALRPFHRFAVNDSGREVLISAKTGEVVRDSTPLARALYWTGNWIHLLRPLDAIGLGKVRRDVLTWLAFFVVAASVTGLIIGWQRWRPGLGDRPTYSQGRVHPYRDVWNTWHFWAGLVGGTAALLWGVSGFLNNNPWQIFSPANPSKVELTRYQGGRSVPPVMLAWRPTAHGNAETQIVELTWRRLSDQAVLLGLTNSGVRIPQATPGTVNGFSEASLLEAVDRLTAHTPVAGRALQTEYDSYYYPRHLQGLVEKPLPVLRVDLADNAGTHLYMDPQDGRLLTRQDSSRRAYRWLFSATHHWDFGWLYQRPIWDAWMLTWVLMGVILSGASVVLGWKRLQLEYLALKRVTQNRHASQQEEKEMGSGLAASRT